MNISLKSIGQIRTPYKENAPYQPVDVKQGNFYLEVKPEFQDGLYRLDGFSHVYVLYFVDRLKKPAELQFNPPWAPEIEVGVFASRSPARPNPIALSVVKLKKIVKNRVYTSGLDAFDHTPLLDIKPYIGDLDAKGEASSGWLKPLDDEEHKLLHLRGIPHDY